MTQHRSFPKTVVVRSEPYRRAVAALPCWFCGVPGFSQAAHADEGKGAMFKSCDTTCYPLCGPHSGVPGCHHVLGMTGQFTQRERRALEHQAAEQTQARLVRDAAQDRALHGLLVKVGVLA